MIKRKVYLTIITLCLLCGLAQAQHRPHWQNPDVVQVNKLPARATSVSYPNETLALAANRDASPRKKSLNGTWKFKWAESPAKAPANFFKTKYSDSKWEDIPVPSNWELHGYGKPWQRLTPQIWADKAVKLPEVPEDYNPTGSYRRTFDMPADWEGMQITLHVGAASSALRVWVNGQYVGYSEDNRLPSEFDITPYLKMKQNLVALQVFQWSDGSYLEDQDHWRMSGITRDVFLEAAPQVQLFDFAVRTNLDEDYRDASLQIRPEIKNYDGTDTEGWTVSAQLYDNEDHAVLDSALEIGVERILNEYYPQIGNRPFENLMQVKLQNPKKWSAEFPNLYTLVLTLRDVDGQLIESRSTRIGFREIDISDGQFKVNGVPVLLYGVNRHDWDAQTGKAVTKAAMRRDAQLMKQLNVNASRSSHYPNPPYWYELCDEYGIYVMDEANIESHAVGSLLSNIPAWHTTFLERGIRMVERDKNYPSIISWSLGNEAGFGPNHAALSAWIKEFDPTRPIHAEGAQNIYGYRWPKPEPNDRVYTDIISRMYRLTDDMIDLATKPNDNRPVIWCEYAHSQGNSTGDLEGYWQAIRRYPRLVGGFVWDWRDQLIHKPGEDGKVLWKHGEDFGQKQDDLLPIQKGLISAHGQVKSGGWQARYVWQRVYLTADSVKKGSFRVENRHFRTNLEHYKVNWEITKEGKVVHSGTSEAPDIGAGKQGLLKLDLPEIAYEAGQHYHIKVAFTLKEDELWADKGFEVASEQFLLHYEPSVVSAPVGVVRVVNETEEQLTLSASDVQLKFDKKTGHLITYSIGGENLLISPPKPNFWRAATDNDRAWGMAQRMDVWQVASEQQQLLSFATDNSKAGIKVNTSYRLAESAALLKLDYTFKADGSLTVNYQLKPEAGMPDLPRLGLQFQVPASFDKLAYFGRGPWETYADKKNGAFFGLYESSVKSDYVYYVRPQESSNKTDVYWATLTDNAGRGIRIEALEEPLGFSSWPFTQSQIEQAGRVEALSFGESNTLNIDYRQMGVGGDNTWNLDARPHEPFRIPAKTYEYAFTIKPIK